MSFLTPPRLSFVTLEINDAAPLTKLLPKLASAEDIMAFFRADRGLVGWGRAATYHAAGSDQFAAVPQWWDSILAAATVEDPLRLPGTGPVLFNSFPFDPNSAIPATAIIPEYLIGHDGDRTWFTKASCRDGETPFTKNRGETLYESLRPSPDADGKPSLDPSWLPVSLSEGALDARTFMAAVGAAEEQIRAGKVGKTVIARDLKVTASAPIQVVELLARLERQEDAWVVCFDGLIGASPEMLLRQRDTYAWSRVLAGSRPVSDAEVSADSMLDDRLLRAEHAFSTRSVEEAFESLDATTSSSVPFPLSLKTVRHIATDITAQLKPSTSPFRTLGALHPSAAVCGTPREEARRLIHRLEVTAGMDRGRFGGPIGWTDSYGNADWCIALRCGSLSTDRKKIRLYAGCGIVAGADPNIELRESTAKFNSMLTALGAFL